LSELPHSSSGLLLLNMDSKELGRVTLCLAVLQV